MPESQNAQAVVPDDTAPEMRPLHDSFLKLDADRKRKLGSLKAEANRLTTEEYLASGRGQETIQSEGDEHRGRLAEHAAMMKRGEDIRRARAQEESLLGVFKKSLATMSERLFGRVRTSETKTGNENSAERPE